MATFCHVWLWPICLLINEQTAIAYFESLFRIHQSFTLMPCFSTAANLWGFWAEYYLWPKNIFSVQVILFVMFWLAESAWWLAAWNPQWLKKLALCDIHTYLHFGCQSPQSHRPSWKMTASALKPHSACVTDTAATTRSTRPVLYAFFCPDTVHMPHTGQLPHGVHSLCHMGFLARHSAHATDRAATTWSARPLPYQFSVQTQCMCAHTGHLPHGVQGLCLMGFLSTHAPYRAPTT